MGVAGVASAPMDHPDLAAAARELARTPAGSPWRPIAATRLRLAEAAEAAKRRAAVAEKATSTH